VAYIGAANGDDGWFFERMSALLQSAGASRVDLAPLCDVPHESHDARRIIEAADLIFVSGGDVEAGMHVLNAGSGATLLRARFAAGVPFVGLSAGSIMLGRTWITWDDPDDDATTRPFACLGFAPLICDAHSEEDGWQELRTLLTRLPAGSVGYGISSSAMIEIHAPAVVKVHGGEVIRLDQAAAGECAEHVLRPAVAE